MKTVKIYLSEEAKSDRGLQITEVCNFLNKDDKNGSDFQVINDNEVQEIEAEVDGEHELVYWIIGEAVEVENGIYAFELDC